jgi:hypothetical protein
MFCCCYTPAAASVLLLHDVNMVNTVCNTTAAAPWRVTDATTTTGLVEKACTIAEVPVQRLKPASCCSTQSIRLTHINVYIKSPTFTTTVTPRIP